MCICSICCLQFRLEKSGKSQRFFFCLESGNPECRTVLLLLLLLLLQGGKMNLELKKRIMKCVVLYVADVDVDSDRQKIRIF